MNCLLLLIILFCCGGNSSCSGNCASQNGCQRREVRRERECGCETSHINKSCPPPPAMPRTQFPYLDVEPRTCGCEEKQNN